MHLPIKGSNVSRTSHIVSIAEKFQRSHTLQQEVPESIDIFLCLAAVFKETDTFRSQILIVYALRELERRCLQNSSFSSKEGHVLI